MGGRRGKHTDVAWFADDGGVVGEVASGENAAAEESGCRVG